MNEPREIPIARRPSRLATFLELRAPFDWATLLVYAPQLARAPRGDGRPVMLLPGYGTDEKSMRPLGRYLRYLGYDVYDWGQGRNRGKVEAYTRAIGERAKELHEEFTIEAIACGPDQPAYIEAYRRAGLNAVAADNSVLPGIDAVEQRLKPDDPRLAERGFTVRPRKGGEEIKTETHGPTRKLKKLLNERSVVPWMRDRLPLIYSGDRLVAVADFWIAADARARPGLRVHWSERPELE